MATWKFEYVVSKSDVHDLFDEVVLRWARVDRYEEGGSRRFAVVKESGDCLGTAIHAAMLAVGNLYPGLTLELLDLYRVGDSYASFLITAYEREC